MPIDLAKLNRVRVTDEPPVRMPCSLCGAPLPHKRVVPFGPAKLIYRATVNGPFVYVPVRHSQAGLCDDPPPETAAFWNDDEARERYKSERRAAADRAAGGWIA